MTNVAMVKMAIEIVDFPMKNMVDLSMAKCDSSPEGMCSLLFGDVCSASEFQWMAWIWVGHVGPRVGQYIPQVLPLFFHTITVLEQSFMARAGFVMLHIGVLSICNPCHFWATSFSIGSHDLSCVYGPLWSPTAAQVVGPLLHARWTRPWDDDKLALGPTLRGSLAGLMLMALSGPETAELPLGTRINKSASSKKKNA